MPRSPARRAGALLKGCAGVLLVAATAWALLQFARWDLTAHLRDAAARDLAQAASGGTPYRWRLSDSNDVIAGRVFSARDYGFGADELVVTSDGNPFEVGLVLARTVDVRRFSGLRVIARCDPSTRLRIRVRERLDGADFISAEIPFGAPPHGLSVDLSTLAWTSGDHPVEAPRAAAMLRLSFALPAGSVARLSTASLDRAVDMQRIRLDMPAEIVAPGHRADGHTAVYRMPEDAETQKAALNTLAALDTKEQLPVLLPQSESIERQLALRSTIYARLPGAILIPDAAKGEAFAQASALASARPANDTRRNTRWISVIAYCLALAFFRLRPPARKRLRASVEAALALAGPLWLVIGDGFDGKPDAAQRLLIGASVLYAISLSVPRHWRWNGSARAWALGAGVVLVALASALLLGGPHGSGRALGQAQLARYLLWALFQQYLICAVCTERWHLVAGSRVLAIYLGALGFALLHFPNGALMLATLAGGMCWCALYLRERALLPLAASHAASAVVLLALLPRDMLWSAEVSARFFQ